MKLKLEVDLRYDGREAVVECGGRFFAIREVFDHEVGCAVVRFVDGEPVIVEDGLLNETAAELADELSEGGVEHFAIPAGTFSHIRE